MKVVDVKSHDVPAEWYNYPIHSHAWKIPDSSTILKQSKQWGSLFCFRVSYLIYQLVFLYKSDFSNGFNFFDEIKLSNSSENCMGSLIVLSVRVKVSWTLWNEQDQNRSEGTMNDKRNKSRFSVPLHIEHEGNENEATVVKHLS